MIEKTRLEKLDELDCAAVDFLLFFQYMYVYQAFKPYASYADKTLVSQTNLELVLKKLNLFSTMDQIKTGTVDLYQTVNYDFEVITKG